MQEITGDLKKHAAQAISLEGQVLALQLDHESQALALHLAGIRTRIATLLSQAEHGRISVTVIAKFKLSLRNLGRPNFLIPECQRVTYEERRAA